jgi:hypothetical protein
VQPYESPIGGGGGGRNERALVVRVGSVGSLSKEGGEAGPGWALGQPLSPLPSGITDAPAQCHPAPDPA